MTGLVGFIVVMLLVVSGEVMYMLDRWRLGEA